jgi:hypothetical protein
MSSSVKARELVWISTRAGRRAVGQAHRLAGVEPDVGSPR